MNANGNPAFKGFGDIRKVHFNKIKRCAKRRNIFFNNEVSIELLWNLFLKQNKLCALSGVELFFGRVHFTSETNASLDRIDSNKGYEIDNIQWVHKDINKLKDSFEQEYLFYLCTKITNKALSL